MLPLHQLSIYREKGVRSPVCLRASLVPIYYHTIAVYSLPRETGMQGPRLSGDCYLETVLGTFTLRTARQNQNTDYLHGTFTRRIHHMTSSSVFLLYANYGYCSPYTNLTSSSHTTQPISISISFGFMSGLVLSPLCTTSHIVLEDILLSLHSHAIDNEHSALVPWTYNLFDCRQLLPPMSGLVASMSGLAYHHSVCSLRHSTLEDSITVHTVASLRPLRGLRF